MAIITKRKHKIKIIIIGLIIGLGVGIGSFTFFYAKGYSYLLNDPAACANCHIMNDEYNGWLKSSHHAVATCNDCHTPQGFFAKYYSKASNGFWHSYGFTTGRFHQPITIKPHNREITENACRKCHQQLIETIDARHPGGTNEQCTRCHNSVGHMK